MKVCIICEKDLPPFDDDMPENVGGGTMDIDFGYGSNYDTGNGFSGRSYHFSVAICDECFEKKKHLGYWVSLERVLKRTVVSEDEIYGQETTPKRSGRGIIHDELTGEFYEGGKLAGE